MISRKGHAIDKKIKYDKMQLESSCRERAFYMSKIDKAKERLSLRPKDYTYSEAKYLLSQLGFEEFNKGKTSGSRVKFYRASDQRIILLHKPHPGDEYWCNKRFGNSFRGDG